MNVALVTYLEQPALADSDELLVEPLKKQGITAVAAPWNDTTIDWKQFNLVILRSCWEYHRQLDTFLSWINNLEKNKVKMLNSPRIIRWNVNKKYLFDLQKKGVNIIPSVLVEKENISKLNSLIPIEWSSLIIKPTVGASGFEIMKIERSELQNSLSRIESQISQNEFIVQPLIKEISSGEYSFIYIKDILGHVMLKTPAIGDFRTNYKFGGHDRVVYPKPVICRQVEDIIKKIDLPFLYARIDGIVVGGQFLLIELELIEPYLFMCEYPPTAKLFAQEISATLHRMAQV
ncbi:hypothetical protein COY90_04040 [Candidatus Roizmanbacteria bacterium CG_4_10_14_0_8_um_filter_39_9]|uniref:Prokaryotic glutathione synthetase ATP-binding domain-containing protein n=1 Tax=Candidatus Roizmanbacteria bacterium CG_4_10_14_0_8_um_filter_39_9 TaxID=1974829 RepID=A0A2M7QC47_9BACT|nr:MAG: hypothetical protein COY90_04040 [Candidatus Roizmanbacteria bacterium CG_4_10_14_0_8_um_filter_39_9]